MTQRERLVELLTSVPTTIGEVVNDQGKHWGAIVSNSVIADHLLNNGVIVPPCKVGEGIYIVTKNSTVPMLSRVANMFFDGETIQFNADDEVFCDFSEDDLGDAVFLTYKQAAQAIKERCNQ